MPSFFPVVLLSLLWVFPVLPLRALQAASTPSFPSNEVDIDVSGYRVSPDGNTIAIVAQDPETPGEKAQKEAKADAEWVNHHPHGNRLYLLHVATGKLVPVPVAPDVLDAYWSSDRSKLLAISEGPNGAGDLAPAMSSWLVSLADQSHPQPLADLPPTIEAAAWTPGQNSILCRLFNAEGTIAPDPNSSPAKARSRRSYTATTAKSLHCSNRGVAGLKSVHPSRRQSVGPLTDDSRLRRKRGRVILLATPFKGARMSPVDHFAGLSTFALLAVLSATAQGPSAPAPPVAAKNPVTDEYHGMKVVDDYRWLEDGKGAETKQWLTAENAYSLAYFKHAAAWNSILQDLKNPKDKPGATQTRLDFRNGRFFYLQLDRTRQQQAVLMTSTSLGTANSPPADARVLLDPTVLDPSGHTSIDWYKPSLDGSLIAVGLAVGGSEREALTVFQTSTGKQLDEAFVPMGFPGAERTVAWLPGNKGFLYAGYDQTVATTAQSTVLENEKVFEHLLGKPEAEDRVVLDKGLTRLAQIALDSDPTGTWIVASAEDGDGGKYANFVRMPDGSWQQISTYSDEVVAVTPGTLEPGRPEEEALYLTSLKDAPRGKILKVSARSPLLANAKVIIPEGTASIEHDDPGRDSHRLAVTGTRLYVTTIDGGPNRLQAYDHSGRFLEDVPLPPLSGVSAVVPVGGESMAIRVSGFLTPIAYTTYQPGPHAQLQATALSQPASRILSGYVADQAFATSKDGTKIPMNIIHRRGSAMDGTVSTLVYGYGGYGISSSPDFVDKIYWRPWLEQGYTLVLTNLRGGAEYGESWHVAGNLTRKQNVFDDFSACAQYLVEHHWSSPAHMAALGGSNGGLLMGAEITQHPEQFRAVVSLVGIYDMLRVELDPNGRFNTTEFGTVKDAAQFRALYAYSPYHHVVDGEKYPAVLMETGDNDPRVNPAHSRKFTARLQAANGSPYPILLKTFADAGHGASSSSDTQQETADIFAFLFEELGVTYATAQ